MTERPEFFNSLVDKWLPEAKGAQLFGIPVDELTPDELAAMCMMFASTTARHPREQPAPDPVPTNPPKRRRLLDIVRMKTNP